MPFAGDTIPLSMQLHDGATDRFVKATVIDDDNIAIAGSPFNMPHQQLGKYSSDAAVMPAAVLFVDVTYEVFDDALFTIPSEDHTIGTDNFPLEVPDQVILDKLNEIIGKLDGVLGSLNSATAIINTSDVVETVIEELQTLAGQIESGEVKAKLKDAAIDAVAIDTDNIDGEIKC